MHSPVEAKSKFGSYRLLNCRAFTAARPAGLDPILELAIAMQQLPASRALPLRLISAGTKSPPHWGSPRSGAPRALRDRLILWVSS